MLMAVEKNILNDLDLQTFVDTFALKLKKSETLEQTKMKLF